MTKYERFLNKQIEVLDEMDVRIDSPTNREMMCVLMGMVYSYNWFASDKKSDFLKTFKKHIEIIKHAENDNIPFTKFREKIISYLQLYIHASTSNTEVEV